jgi:cytoskeletal protein CcmA (bactofilin family)
MLAVQGLGMFWKRPESVTHDSLTAFIDESSQLEGRYSFSGTVILNGKFKGDIESPGTLVVGRCAVAQGDIRVRTVLVDGEVVGDITAVDRLHLRSGARVLGRLETSVLQIDTGVTFEGQVRMANGEHAETLPIRDRSFVPARP